MDSFIYPVSAWFLLNVLVYDLKKEGKNKGVSSCFNYPV